MRNGSVATAGAIACVHSGRSRGAAQATTSGRSRRASPGGVAHTPSSLAACVSAPRMARLGPVRDGIVAGCARGERDIARRVGRIPVEVLGTSPPAVGLQRSARERTWPRTRTRAKRRSGWRRWIPSSSSTEPSGRHTSWTSYSARRESAPCRSRSRRTPRTSTPSRSTSSPRTRVTSSSSTTSALSRGGTPSQRCSARTRRARRSAATSRRSSRRRRCTTSASTTSGAVRMPSRGQTCCSSRAMSRLVSTRGPSSRGGSARSS